MQIIDKICWFFFHEKFDRFVQIFQHEISSFEHMFRLRIIITLVMFLISFLFFHFARFYSCLRKDPLVFKNLKTSLPWVAAIFKNQKISFYVHFVGLIWSHSVWLRKLSPLILSTLDIELQSFESLRLFGLILLASGQTNPFLFCFIPLIRVWNEIQSLIMCHRILFMLWSDLLIFEIIFAG